MRALSVPCPPSVNAAWRAVPSSPPAIVPTSIAAWAALRKARNRPARIHLTPAGTAFRDAVITRTRAAGILPVADGPVAVRVRVHPPDRVRDIDNLLKALFDAGTHARWWTDDAQVVEVDIAWDAAVADGAEVAWWPAAPLPEPRPDAIALSWPPSVNRLWRWCGTRMVMDRRSAAARDRLVWELRAARGRWPDPASHGVVVVDLVPPRRGRVDTDNRAKAILDAATHAGLWPDDAVVRRLIIRRRDPRPPGGVRVAFGDGIAA